jgi:hypothetical protein
MSERDFLTAFDEAIASFEIARAQDGKKPNPAVAGSDLAEILLSRQLTMDQQWFLARFFLGDIHKHKKPGQPKVTSSSDMVQAVASHYIARCAINHKKTAIYQEIEERFGLKRSTIHAYLKMVGRDNWQAPRPSLVEHCQEEVSAWGKSR